MKIKDVKILYCAYPQLSIFHFQFSTCLIFARCASECKIHTLNISLFVYLVKRSLTLLGIAFFITNYFCGNKSVFAALNSHQCTSSTISVVCLAKTEPQTAISYPQKCEAPKRAYFLMIFCEREAGVLNVLQSSGRRKAQKSRLLGN